ncbi:MAG: cbb3-type cytochrome c oxidase subunit I [Verrucomicrobiota bacterium]|jgi:cytochrome c oxidase cbb3-type subunit 1
MTEMKTQDARAETPDPKIDASCRVPLLALFGGAALWLVIGSVLAMIASIKFHAPDFLADCPWLTYGRVQPAADNALLYGFCIPAALGVMLWIFARLSRTPLCLPFVPVIAANLWHLGVLVGLVGILIGDSTGFTWLEFPRGGPVLLFVAFLLIAISAVATFGERRERELFPSHWFLLAALLWFPWIYATGNLFLVAWPVRGIIQAAIDFWFANNLLFVWLGLTGLGVSFYFLPKFAGRPLQSHYLALFAFWTLILFGTWNGIPAGAPLPAWMPALSAVAGSLTIIPVLAVIAIMWKTLCGSTHSEPRGGPFCFIRFGLAAFVLSSLMLIAMACPQISRVTEFTWFGPAQTQLQLYGFFAMTMFGAIYYVLPRAVGFEFPFPKLARAHFWISMLGVLVLVVPLAIGGVVQGLKWANPGVAPVDVARATLPFLRASTTGLLFLLFGNLLFALNIFGLTVIWKLALLKKAIAIVKAPLETVSASASLRRDRAAAEDEGGEVKA